MKNQRGSVLLFSLVILFVLTVLAVSTMSTSLLDEKMAKNVQLRQHVFQATQNELTGQRELYYLDNQWLLNSVNLWLNDANPNAWLLNPVAVQPPPQAVQTGFTKTVALTFSGELTPPGSSFGIFSGYSYDCLLYTSAAADEG